MPITPPAKFSELLYFRMAMVAIILYGETFGVENAHIATKPEKDSRGFIGHKPGI